MNILKERFFLISLLLVYSFCLNGQQNPSEINLTVLENSQYHIDIQSTKNPIFIQPHPEIFDSLRITIITPGNKNYRYHYTAGAPGSFQVIVEYYEDGSFPGWDPPKYTTINIDIVNSTLIPQHDYFTIIKDSGITELDVLSNDSSSHHPLTLFDIVLQQNGIANNQGDSLVNFTPDPGFSGMAYVNYVASNDLGLTAMGTASICVIDTSIHLPIDTIRLSTTNKQAISILLPSSNFVMDAINTPALGEVNFLNGDAVSYTPYLDSEGLDTFLLHTIDTMLQRLVIMDVIYIDEDNSFVKDDIVYTSVNTPVTFNVYDNDLKTNNLITSYSNALTRISGGVFSYNPPTGYKGVKKFYYTVYNGLEFQTAHIYIHVNNFYPEDLPVFNLTTLKNTPLVVQYEIPIDNFDFTILSFPNNGTLSVQSGSGSINTACQNIDGFNLLSYVPGLNFIGEDEFDLEYCIDGAQCEVVKIHVDVMDMDSSCYCVGPECVWAGDADANGLVSVADILPIGFHMGAMGSNRGGADPMAWYGQFSNEWNDAMYNGKDSKHADTNGDGIVSASDTTSVSSHYNLYHNITADKSLIIKEYPVSIIPHQTTYDSGDFVLLDIAIGDNQYPIIDLHGLAYSLQIAPSFIDSASLEVDFREDLWFGNNSATLDMAKQPSDGQIEMAFTRTSGYSVSGNGIITTVGFIGEDDLDGIRIEAQEGQIPVKIHLTSITMLDGQGNEYILPDASTTILLNYDLREGGELTEDKVIIYPNPANDMTKIHVNGRDEFEEIVIFDQLAQKVRHIKSIASNDYKLDVRDLPIGMYILHIKTLKGAVVKKLQVIKTD